jgi:hypothetical protein
VSGKLIMNALVMYDHQTDTLWSQFLSRGVQGPLSGTQLEIVPSVQTTWQQWLQLRPDTLVLDKRGGYQFDSYEGYYAGGSAGILGESNKDNRLPGKELVLGAVHNGTARAYPFVAIAGQRVINDSFGDDDVVVAFDGSSETGAIFNRSVDGRTLTFEDSGANGLGVMLIQDRETGSTWQAFTGQAIEGPMAGKTLDRLPSHYSFWFAWSDFHPDTELFESS